MVQSPSEGVLGPETKVAGALSIGPPGTSGYYDLPASQNRHKQESDTQQKNTRGLGNWIYLRSTHISRQKITPSRIERETVQREIKLATALGIREVEPLTRAEANGRSALCVVIHISEYGGGKKAGSTARDPCGEYERDQEARHVVVERVGQSIEREAT